MPTFNEDEERINLFEISDTLFFYHYFDNRDLSKTLCEWNVKDSCRFEVPQDEYERVEEILQEYDFESINIVDPTRFCVAINYKTEYKDILRNSVHHWAQGGRRCFIMRDQLEVKKAIEHGADKADPRSLKSVGRELKMAELGNDLVRIPGGFKWLARGR